MTSQVQQNGQKNGIKLLQNYSICIGPYKGYLRLVWQQIAVACPAPTYTLAPKCQIHPRKGQIPDLRTRSQMTLQAQQTKWPGETATEYHKARGHNRQRENPQKPTNPQSPKRQKTIYLHPN